MAVEMLKYESMTELECNDIVIGVSMSQCQCHHVQVSQPVLLCRRKGAQVDKRLC